MRLGAILRALASLVLAAWLLFLNFDEVLTLLASAGAGLTIVITLHGVQIIFRAQIPRSERDQRLIVSGMQGAGDPPPRRICRPALQAITIR